MTLGILRLYYFITYYHIIVIMSTDFVIISLDEVVFLQEMLDNENGSEKD